MKVRKIELGNTGHMLNQYSLGTMLMGSTISKEDSFTILDDYVSRGGSFLDTANCYAWWIGKGEFCGDESENIIGNWMSDRKNRENIFLATKVGARLKDHMAIRNENGIPRWEEIPQHYEGASAGVIRKSTQESLKRLKTDFIDLLYIHVDDKSVALEETLSTLDAMVKEGLVRHIGFSNIQTWRLEKVMNLCKQNGWIKPVAVQMEYSFVNPARYDAISPAFHAKEDLFDWLKDYPGVSLVAYSPLLKGIFCDIKKRDVLLENRDYDSTYTRKKLERIDTISTRLDVNPNALVLAWMAHKKDGIFPLIGFSKLEQYKENFQCLDIELDEETLKELNS